MSISSIRVSTPDVSYNDRTATVRCAVSSENLPPFLWFEVPIDLAKNIAIERPDWIYASLLMPAMIRGARLIVDAPISEKLYYSMTGDLQYILSKQDNRLLQIPIITKGFVSKNVQAAVA